MRIRRAVRELTVTLFTAMMLVGTVPGDAFSTVNAATAGSLESEFILASAAQNDYSRYDLKYKDAQRPITTINILGSSFVESENPESAKITALGREGAVIGENNKWSSWEFTIPEDGRYAIKLVYLALPGKGKDIEFSLKLDDKIPFSEASRLSLSRIWKDFGKPERDSRGNDLRPSQVEVSRWNTRPLMNTEGYYDEAYAFYLTKGTHRLTLTSVQESMAIAEIRVGNDEPLPSYQEYSAGAKAADAYIKIFEAEQTLEKSSSMLYPTYDRSSSATSPSHYSRIRLNTIGQTNWQYQTQWLSWKIDVPKDGWYQISFKSRQNYQHGNNSYRSLYIDNKIPFKEARALCFKYDLQWYMMTPSVDGKPCLFYLESGEHELTLESMAGPMAPVLKGLNDAVLDLNTIYRNIIMVTGTTPDIYRTFYLEDEIPGLMDSLKQVKSTLDSLYAKIQELTGANGSQASIVKQMSVMVESFIRNPMDIPERISNFKSNIESIGSLILLLSEQPLELDYIVVSSQEDLPDVKASFWDDLVFNVQSFLASFVEDYSSIGQTYSKDAITVWISNGRDQAQILKNMIDDQFTEKTGIPVNMSIVSLATGLTQSTLVQATLAGKGPDVALFTPKDTPVNLAMRGALLDISKFPDYQKMKDRFYDSAWIPYRYEGGVYAVPETQNYDMLFYRKDILEMLGLTPPQTWDDFYKAISILQQNNLQVGVLETNSVNAGISSGISIFEKFLLQNGGTYYNDDLTKTAFDSKVSCDAFTRWTELYTEYGLDRSFDFYNRFRTGEMPIGIQPYTMYNQLYVAAPEIRGLWGFTVIPGTPKPDGSIDRTETASGTAAIILSDAKDPEAAFKFIDWWTSADTQTRYGNELEAILGVAARYDTANKEAFQNLAWSETESKTLIQQWEMVTDIPQIPGNYFISRCLTNAFRTVVDENENPIPIFNRYIKDMNSEIARKRKEFKLD